MDLYKRINSTSISNLDGLEWKYDCANYNARSEKGSKSPIKVQSLLIILESYLHERTIRANKLRRFAQQGEQIFHHSQFSPILAFDMLIIHKSEMSLQYPTMHEHINWPLKTEAGKQQQQ